MSNIVKLFKYSNHVDLMYVDSIIRRCVLTNNSPLNNLVTKLHRGVDNEIRFRVLNPDRKRVSVDHLSIRARLVNPQNGERVLDRFANLVPGLKGELRLTIYEGDLVNIAPGFYNLIVTGEETLVPQQVGENVQTPFYVDTGGDIVATVEVVGSADATPQPTVTLLPENWTIHSSDHGVSVVYYSSAIPGSRIKNHINGVHTFAAYTTAFTGTLEVRGSLDLLPPSSYTGYFPIDITAGTQVIEFENYTGVTSHSFEANFMWLLFIYSPDTSLPDYGTVDKVMLR